MMHSISKSIVFEVILVIHMACHLSMIISVENASLITVPFQHFLYLTGLKLNGLDVSEHVEPEEGHHPDEANSEPGGDEHEVHELKKVSSRTHISWADIFKIFSCVHKARFIVHTCTGSQNKQSNRKVVTPFC